jgi:hypothetical protein
VIAGNVTSVSLPMIRNPPGALTLRHTPAHSGTVPSSAGKCLECTGESGGVSTLSGDKWSSSRPDRFNHGGKSRRVVPSLGLDILSLLATEPRFLQLSSL